MYIYKPQVFSSSSIDQNNRHMNYWHTHMILICCPLIVLLRPIALFELLARSVLLEQETNPQSELQIGCQLIIITGFVGCCLCFSAHEDSPASTHLDGPTWKQNFKEYKRKTNIPPNLIKESHRTCAWVPHLWFVGILLIRLCPTFTGFRNQQHSLIW